MKRLLRPLTVGFSIVMLGVTALAADNPPPIPAGSTLQVRLETTLTDKTSKTGDSFTGLVAEPIVVNGKEVVPKYSSVRGHVAFVKPSGRIRGKAQMRVVIDSLTTPENVVYPLTGSLENAQNGDCNDKGQAGKGTTDEEGTITGCGKSKKDAAKSAAIAGAIGAGAGATVGLGSRGGCDYYGNCYPSSGPGLGADIGIGAGVGAGTALIYTLFRHEKHVVLVEGSTLTFVVNRNTLAEAASPATPPPGQ